MAVCNLASLPASLTAPRPKPPTPSLPQGSQGVRVVADARGGAANAGANVGGGGGDGQGAPRPPFPKLAWFSLGGNPACGPAPAPRPDLLHYAPGDVAYRRHAAPDPGPASAQLPPAPSGAAAAALPEAGRKLGEGASGEVFAGVEVGSGEAVAVKVFRWGCCCPPGPCQHDWSMNIPQT